MWSLFENTGFFMKTDTETKIYSCYTSKTLLNIKFNVQTRK